MDTFAKESGGGEGLLEAWVSAFIKGKGGHGLALLLLSFFFFPAACFADECGVLESFTT